MKTALSGLLLIAALLAGCGSEAPPAPAPVAADAAPAAADPAPAATPPATTETAPAAPDAAPATTPAPDPRVTDAAKAGTAPADTGTASASAPLPPPTGPEPQEGVHYTLIDPPAPLAPATGKIEVAEAFAYYCIHCANMDKLIAPWKARLPADVDFRYVPMAHGQSEPFARAFYAAEAMGELDRFHAGAFEAIAVKREVKQPSDEALADVAADLGIDRDAFLATMRSFAVNAQIARAQKAIPRWGIESTPSVVVAGKYRVQSTETGHAGVLNTVEHLLARERAAVAGTGTGTNPAQ